METAEWTTRLAKLRDGDLHSFRWVYDRQHPKVYGFCLKLLGSPIGAEEITSDVFVRLWEKRSIVDPTLNIRPLLFKITRDLAWNYLKKDSRQSAQHLRYTSQKGTFESARVESDLILNDYIQIAESAIGRLPGRQREIFNLRYKSGLDSKQIARQLNLSESTVRVQLAKASRYLRDYLKGHPELLGLLFLPLT